MEFCPKCKSMMRPSGGVLKCRKCGFEKKAGNEAIIVGGAASKPEREITVLEGKDDAGLPTTDEQKCPECGNQKAYWWMRQLRSADESEVRFFRCTACGKTWREYN
ncbi:transcription factor S [Methanocella sp. CWC-04]|uniref:Transcription factor S n=1 Tax=Methanooceanicella nereidis TaxID=2052831 RepID=A0AAP2W652_9EURY|nr:transcription factor S [Methanocella sp. CWC-04]MCD1293726.1 transcription factor S [Methanocella sp. CWC-04]